MLGTVRSVVKELFTFKEAVEKAATEDHRSLTSLVEQLLTSLATFGGGAL